MHLQRRRIPCAAEPQANRAIATAISRQRIDHPSPRDKKGRRRNRRELRQRASIAAPCAPESPSVVRRRPKHSSMFHVKQIYFYGSKTAILHNTPQFKHRLALLHRACSAPFTRSFQKHITSSAHNPHTFFARYTPFDSKAHCRQSPPFRAATPYGARIAAQYMPLSTLAAQAVQSRYRAPPPRAEQNISRAQHATTNGETGESASRKPNAAQSTSGRRLFVLRPKTSINIDFLPMFHVKQPRLLHYGDRYARRHYPCGSISIS